MTAREVRTDVPEDVRLKVADEVAAVLLGARDPMKALNAIADTVLGFPAEPPLGTWVQDRRGAVSVRIIDSTGRDGWAPGPYGFYACAKWEAMWRAHGPLVECRPYGR